ncbi:MAG TPA: hypothetical protein PLC06_16480, partial [Promineifilum sp.]|nr:hypothetical protein [Promineifilum sp.]
MIAEANAPDRTAPVRRWATYREYLATADDTRIVEWADGEIIEYMPPNTVHQKITWFLFRLFSAFAERFDLGLVGAA